MGSKRRQEAWRAKHEGTVARTKETISQELAEAKEALQECMAARSPYPAQLKSGVIGQNGRKR
jgi:chaperonin cofactor prefoldin